VRQRDTLSCVCGVARGCCGGAGAVGEDQAVACEWRKRSPNGLTPLLSGCGVPRATPLSQSRSIVRYLAARLGMAGATELAAMRADVLYETAKDLGAKTAEIIGEEGAVVTDHAKGAPTTMLNIEKVSRTAGGGCTAAGNSARADSEIRPSLLPAHADAGRDARPCRRRRCTQLWSD
jgi:hypothetical protein